MPARPPLPFFVLVAYLLFAGAAPAFAQGEPKLSVAAAALEEGRYEDALDALAADSSPEALYLRARALAELGRYGEALDTLGEPPETWPAGVREDLRALRLKWAAEAGRCAELESAVQGKSSKDARRTLGRCLFSSGDYARAADLLQNETDASSRGLRIRALVALGDKAGALPLARAFYVDNPAHRDASFCEQLLKTEEKKLVLSVEEHMQRAEGWLAARKPETAHAELAGLDARTPKQLRARLWHLRGEALFKTRHTYPEAEKAFTKAAKYKGDTEAYDAFHAIRAASRAGQDAAAIKRYRAFARRYPKSELTQDAMYLAAWLSAREKRPDARTALKQFVDSDYGAKAPGLRRDALWDLAWFAIERNDPDDALHWLEVCGRDDNKSMQAARVAYWQGRAALLKREPARAREYFHTALLADRLGYYAQLSARRLMELGDPAPSPFDPDVPVIAAPVLTPPADIEFYRRLGLRAEASSALDSWLESLPERSARVEALVLAGNVAEAHQAAAPFLDQVLPVAPEGASRWLWDALFPKPYWTSVEASTARHNLPSALFYGHMQVESRYKPKAVSGADAIGLMQLLPATAAKVAESLAIPADRAALMRPHINVALAAQYLSGLIQRYHGQLPLAIAAYNAGTSRVDGWLGDKPVELDRWVERIPVEQTRNYVRRVLSAYSRYHALESPEAPWDLPIPEEVSLHTR